MTASRSSRRRSLLSEKIGERVTRFLIEHPDLMVVNTEVRQSSDSSHHCLTVLVFWRRRP